MCIRFINIIIVFSIFFQTTHPDDLSQALEKIGLPYSIALTISLAFRFVPTIAQETETISEAQRSRGMNIQKGGLIQQIKNLFALLIPLISNSIQRAYYVAESLETRSFSVNNKRTNLFDLKFTKKDVLFSIYFLFFFIVGIILFININQLPNWILYSLPI